MIISKEAFCDIINKLIKTNDFIDEVNAKARKLDNAIESDFFNASSLSISFETDVVYLLGLMFNDLEKESILSWWIYEQDYGRAKGTAIWKNDKYIDISTPEKLYDYLVKEMENTNENTKSN